MSDSVLAPVKSGYAPVNGLEMYYEIHGSGQPLVLLHGSLSAIGTSFGALLPLLAQDRQVIAVEYQAHGRTADVDRPLTVPQLADDTAALIRHLCIARADILGYSLGAGIALDLAIRHPELVRKLVLISLAITKAGLHPGLIEGIQMLQPEHLAGSPFQEEYAQLAPHPDDWPALIAKIKQMNQSVQEWPAGAIQAIKAPSFIVIGDSDIVQPEHAVEVFRLLGGGVVGDMVGLPQSRLAILPGTTHVSITYRAGWIAPMVNEFLDAPWPTAN